VLEGWQMARAICSISAAFIQPGPGDRFDGRYE
jgi:hypothetical protein